MESYENVWKDSEFQKLILLLIRPEGLARETCKNHPLTFDESYYLESNFGYRYEPYGLSRDLFNTLYL
jgi:hypothetical protein